MEIPAAEAVSVSEDALTVELSDGRTLSVPLAWYPRLVHGSPEERARIPAPSEPTTSSPLPLLIGLVAMLALEYTLLRRQ